MGFAVSSDKNGDARGGERSEHALKLCMRSLQFFIRDAVWCRRGDNHVLAAQLVMGWNGHQIKVMGLDSGSCNWTVKVWPLLIFLT